MCVCARACVCVCVCVCNEEAGEEVVNSGSTQCPRWNIKDSDPRPSSDTNRLGDPGQSLPSLALGVFSETCCSN